MHRSRIGSVVIDCDDYAAGVAFWSAAVGARPDGDGGQWASISDVVGGVRLLLQRVPEPRADSSGKLFSRGEDGQARPYACPR